MGKNEFMSPKAIANRIKSKGLQKLRWYCQLCQKQCRDENGFKCHQMSDSHRRQMDLFGLNADKVVDGFSEEFETAFLDHLKRAHPFSRVLAKNVYNEFIADKNHIHMNSTKWLTLTEFVKHLGREGKCKVEESEKGWWITLIQKDPMLEIAEERKLKRTAAEREEEERLMAEIEAQAERARKVAKAEADDSAPSGGELIKTDDSPVVLSLLPGADAAPSGPSSRAGPAAGARVTSRLAVSRGPGAFGDDDDELSQQDGKAPGKGASKLHELMQKELQAKAKHAEEAKQAAAPAQRSGPWLQPGIVVKVMSKKLQEHGYYKKKGVVKKVVDKFLGQLVMLDSEDELLVDQAELETVIPQPGGVVLVLLGRHKGYEGILQEINTDKFQALVKLCDGPDKGQKVWMEYEDISKLS